MSIYLEEVDAARLGPSETITPINDGAAAEAIRSAEQFVTPAAVEELRRVELQAQQSTISGGRAKRRLGATWRNLLRSAFVITIGAAGIGYTIVKEAIPILRWIGDHADFIRQILANRPSMLSVLEWLLNHLPPL